MQEQPSANPALPDNGPSPGRLPRPPGGPVTPSLAGTPVIAGDLRNSALVGAAVGATALAVVGATVTAAFWRDALTVLIVTMVAGSLGAFPGAVLGVLRRLIRADRNSHGFVMAGVLWAVAGGCLGAVLLAALGAAVGATLGTACCLAFEGIGPTLLETLQSGLEYILGGVAVGACLGGCVGGAAGAIGGAVGAAAQRLFAAWQVGTLRPGGG